MNWYKKSKITFNEFGEPSIKWPRGWKCNVKKEKDNLYWASLKFNGNLIQSFPGDYPSQARQQAFKWLEWHLKNDQKGNHELV